MQHVRDTFTIMFNFVDQNVLVISCDLSAYQAEGLGGWLLKLPMIPSPGSVPNISAYAHLVCAYVCTTWS